MLSSDTTMRFGHFELVNDFFLNEFRGLRESLKDDVSRQLNGKIYVLLEESQRVKEGEYGMELWHQEGKSTGVLYDGENQDCILINIPYLLPGV